MGFIVSDPQIDRTDRTDRIDRTEEFRTTYPDAFSGLTVRQAGILADTLALGSQRGAPVSAERARLIAAKIRGLLAD
ncbi:hypothetical protein Csp1_27480 [Corynebacterium provencense]|uniref:Uncharacterized protein n=1 Tax=Corynebacterium provencense TaxID=1737425 RepID=A0A2Z3YUX2_9CORY|nr:hypothetical protein [Corynebacterium provencense]AWT27491.1 hypothetical protein Csp1_27480 [Corynebacterium provencense]